MGPFLLVFRLGCDVRNSIRHKREGPAYPTHARHTQIPPTTRRIIGVRMAGSQKRIHAQ